MTNNNNRELSSADIWINDHCCLVCQEKCPTKESKTKHEKEEIHKNRISVFKFLKDQLPSLKLTEGKQSSLLYERYYRSNILIAGLDCICELRFSKGFAWACTICYTAGRTFDEADSHLYSSRHKRNYINEYTTSYDSLNKQIAASTPEMKSFIEHETISHILVNECKGLMPPDVYAIEDKSIDWAVEELGLKHSSDLPYVTEPLPDSTGISYLLCLVCGQCFYAKTNESDEIWAVHSSSKSHQHYKYIQTVLNESKVSLEDRSLETLSYRTRDDVNFMPAEGQDYSSGQTCGLEYLIMFDRCLESFCELCSCVIANINIIEHFSCEAHIKKFVTQHCHVSLLNIEYLKKNEVYEILRHCLVNEIGPSEKMYKYSKGPLPHLLKRIGIQEQRSLQLKPIGSLRKDFGNGCIGIWCEDCKDYVTSESDEAENDDAWSMHIFDDSHFQNAVQRIKYGIDNYENGLMNISPDTIWSKFEPADNPSWEEIPSATFGLINIQDHCEFGLQHIVRDTLGSSKKLIWYTA